MKHHFTKKLFLMGMAALGFFSAGCRTGVDTSSDPSANTDVISAPSNVAASAISTSEIHVTWINPDYSENFRVFIEYKKTASTNYTAMDVNQVTQQTLAGLEPNTGYDVRLKAVADDGQQSEYSGVVSAITTVGLVAHPVAALTSSSVYDGQVLIGHAWSSSDASHVQNIYCESKLVSSFTNWDIYKTGSGADFSNASFCNTTIGGPENVGNRQYRIRVSFDDGAADSISSVTAVFLPKLPAPTNTQLFVGNNSLVSWTWLETFNAAYHAGFKVYYSIANVPMFYDGHGASFPIAPSTYYWQTNVCDTNLYFFNTPWAVSGPITFSVAALGTNSAAHHDYPVSSDASTAVTGVCP